MKNHNLFRLLIIVIVFFSFITNDQSFAQNVALGKKYEVSIKPNYKIKSSNLISNILTDGKSSTLDTTLFWLKKSTLGWQGIEQVIISFDLKELINLDKITFNTGRGSKSNV